MLLTWFECSYHHLEFVNALLTIVGLWVAYELLSPLYVWGIRDAVGQAADRRECLDTSPYAACWAGILTWNKAFVYGRYPASEQWRINLGFLIFLCWIAPVWCSRVRGRVLTATSVLLAYPFLAGYLFAGGAPGWLMRSMVVFAAGVFCLSTANAVLCLGTNRSLGSWMRRIAKVEAGYRP